MGAVLGGVVVVLLGRRNQDLSVGLQGSCILILDPDRFDLTVGGRQRLFS
jgi:hypothetical protein